MGILGKTFLSHKAAIHSKAFRILTPWHWATIVSPIIVTTQNPPQLPSLPVSSLGTYKMTTHLTTTPWATVAQEDIALWVGRYTNEDFTREENTREEKRPLENIYYEIHCNKLAFVIIGAS